MRNWARNHEFQAAALKLVNEIFGDDIARAKEPAAKTRLATQLMQQARESRKDDLAAPITNRNRTPREYYNLMLRQRTWERQIVRRQAGGRP